MNKPIRVSAPGKLMLFGEHAVVYGKPCIVTAVGQRMQVTVSLSDDKKFHLQAPEVFVEDYSKPLSELALGEVPKGAKFVESAVKNMFEKYSISTGLNIETKSQFTSTLGFGSSSASTVCIIKALSELHHLDLTPKAIFDIAYKTVLDIQGKGSGFDIAAAVYGGTLYYKNGGEVIEPLVLERMPLVVVYSGVKADTVTLVNQVASRREVEPDAVDGIFESIAGLVEKAKTALTASDWAQCGSLMNENQEYLKELGVSTPTLDTLIAAAQAGGAYGAKLSGAGGGDCIVALGDESSEKSITSSVTEAGGEIIPVATGVPGVKREE